MMKRNILRAAVAASILGISGVAFASDTADVPFTGTVEDLCKLDADPTGGTIALANTLGKTDRLTARPAETSNGALGSFTYKCSTGTANLTVNTPEPTGGDPFTSALESVPGYTKGANIYDDNGGTNSIAEVTDSDATAATASAQPGVPTTYYVSMWAETSGTDIPSGDYAYTVTIDIVDN